jgi:hypothetical protein
MPTDDLEQLVGGLPAAARQKRAWQLWASEQEPQVDPLTEKLAEQETPPAWQQFAPTDDMVKTLAKPEPDLGMFYNRRGLKGAAITLAAPFVAGYNILAGAAKGADELMRYGYQPGADDGSREVQIGNAVDAGGLAAGSALPMVAARGGNTLGIFGGRLKGRGAEGLPTEAAPTSVSRPNDPGVMAGALDQGSASPARMEKVTGASGELARLREGPPSQPLRNQSLFDADAQALFKQPPKWFDDYHGTLWNLHTRDLVKAGSEQEFSSLLSKLRNDKSITAVDAHEIADTFHEAARAKLHPSNSMGDEAFKNPVIADRFNRIELEIFKKQRGDPDFVPHPNSHWWEGTPPGFKEKYGRGDYLGGEANTNASLIKEGSSSAARMEKVTGAERPVEAAIKYKGEVYTGSNHVRIMDDLDRRFGRTSVDDMADGFVTSSGRFVSRDEASKLSGKQEPFDWNDLHPEDAAASIRKGVQVQGKAASASPGEKVTGAKVWYHGSPEAGPHDLDMAKSGSRNGGAGAIWLSPREATAEGHAGQSGHVRSLEADVKNPFVWDIRDVPGTVKRAQQVWPEFKLPKNTDTWLTEGDAFSRAFTDKIRAAGFDAIDIRGPNGATHELAVLDKAILRDARRGDLGGSASPGEKVTGSGTPIHEQSLRRPTKLEIDEYTDASEKLWALGSGDRSQMPLVTVDTRDLLRTEPQIYRKQVEAYKRGEVTGDSTKVPAVASLNGKLYVIDGHHKLTAVMEDGGKTADVVLYDFNNPGTYRDSRTLTELPKSFQRRGDYLGGEAKDAKALKDPTLYSDAKGRGSAVANVVNANRPRVENPIKVYHGSPHDFDKFDSSKIGTGEGAQAFGHGLYFAENPGTAQSYKLAGQPAFRSHVVQQRVKDALDANGGNEAAAKNWLNDRMLRATDQPTRQHYQDAVNNFDAVLKDDVGRLYEVSLHAKPEQFLDWDLPLSKQSEGVRKVLQPYEDAVARDWSVNPTLGRPTTTGQVLAGLFNDRMKEQLSKDLREAGVTGIRYKDQGSRGKDGGTSNYVVFDDSVIEIIGKDGKPLQGAEKAKVVKELYAKQGLPVPGGNDEEGRSAGPAQQNVSRPSSDQKERPMAEQGEKDRPKKRAWEHFASP